MIGYGCIGCKNRTPDCEGNCEKHNTEMKARTHEKSSVYNHEHNLYVKEQINKYKRIKGRRY